MQNGRFVREFLGRCLLAAAFTTGVTGAATASSSLGAVYTPQATTFSIWSPDTDDVKLSLQGEAQLLPMARLPDTDEYTDVYSITVPGDHHLKRYNYSVNGQTVRDPYGVMVEPASNNNIVVDLSKTEPVDGWVPSPALAEREDAIIYEVNVHDFTIDPASGVPDPKRGKFLGMVEHGTRFQNRPTGIDHLIDLGITHVQIMPMFDFRGCSALSLPNPPNCYNWGYDPQNYNVPEENYSQFPSNPIARIRELKTMD